MGKLGGKKVLMVIASRDFRDEEYQKPRAILEREGAKVTVACSATEPSRGMLGLVVKPDLLLGDAKAADYDGIVFVGGNGASEYWDDPKAHALAREFHAKGKPTGAICIAPVTLANAGVLKGKSATSWPDVVSKVQAKGAGMRTQACVTDGNVVTADGPQSAEAFGDALAEALAK